MGIESDVEIDRCHRIGRHKTKTGQNRDQPRTVVCIVFNKDKLTHSKPLFKNLNALNAYQINTYKH